MNCGNALDLGRTTARPSLTVRMRCRPSLLRRGARNQLLKRSSSRRPLSTVVKRQVGMMEGESSQFWSTSALRATVGGMCRRGDKAATKQRCQVQIGAAMAVTTYG